MTGEEDQGLGQGGQGSDEVAGARGCVTVDLHETRWQRPSLVEVYGWAGESVSLGSSPSSHSERAAVRHIIHHRLRTGMQGRIAAVKGRAFQGAIVQHLLGHLQIVEPQAHVLQLQTRG